MKIEIKHITGDVIFSHEEGGNTQKKTIELAIKKGIDLSGADLRYSNLLFADLRYSNLMNSDLSFADLRYSNLNRAYLMNANLKHSNLLGANLKYTNFSFADLSYANLMYTNKSYIDLTSSILNHAILYDNNLTNPKIFEITSLKDEHLINYKLTDALVSIYCKWDVFIINDKIKIGCETKTIPEWDEWFNGDKIYVTHRNTDDFKRIYANYIAVREYYKQSIAKNHGK